MGGDMITWPVAVTFLGSIAVFATFLASYLKQEKRPWGNDLQDIEEKLKEKANKLEHRVTVLEGKNDNVVRRLEELKVALTEKEKSNESKHEKNEKKIERITEIVIDILQSVNSGSN